MLLQNLQMLSTYAALPIPMPMAHIINKPQNSFLSGTNLRIIFDTALQMATTNQFDLACEMKPIFHLGPRVYRLFAN